MWVAANRSQHSAIRIEGSIEAPPRTRRVERIGRPAARPTGWPERCERLRYFVRSVKTRQRRMPGCPRVVKRDTVEVMERGEATETKDGIGVHPIPRARPDR